MIYILLCDDIGRRAWDSVQNCEVRGDRTLHVSVGVDRVHRDTSDSLNRVHELVWNQRLLVFTCVIFSEATYGRVLLGVMKVFQTGPS